MRKLKLKYGERKLEKTEAQKTKLKCLLATLLIVSVLIIFSTNALALGISPAKTELKFEPGQEKTITYKVVNNDRSFIDAYMYVQNELENYIKLEQTNVTIDQDEEFKEYSFKLKFPDSLPPGRRESKIIVEERIPQLKLGDSYISARLKLAHKIFVDVPTPDKYLTVQISATDTGETLEIQADVKNEGDKNIEKLKSSFEVQEGDKTLAKADSDEKSLNAKGEAQLKAEVEKNFGNGEYNIVADISYDDNSLELTKKIVVGAPKIEALTIDKIFIADKINELNVDLKNNWNKKIGEVYTIASLYDGSTKISDIRSTTVSIEPKEVKKIKSYLDARSTKTGKYALELETVFADTSTKQRFDVEFVTDEEFAKRAARTAASGGGITLDTTAILVIVIGLMGAAIGGLIVRNRGRPAGGRKGRK